RQATSCPTRHPPATNDASDATLTYPQKFVSRHFPDLVSYEREEFLKICCTAAPPRVLCRVAIPIASLSGIHKAAIRIVLRKQGYALLDATFSMSGENELAAKLRQPASD